MLISIITPSFNSEKTIERTIQSVLKQSFKDYEYIIVDGGSTDSTIDIIKKYENKFEGRLKWKSEPDDGVYNAFNKGIKSSIGEYVWVVNSDDYMMDDALNSVMNHIRNVKLDSVGVLCGAMKVLNENDKTYYISYTNEEDKKRAFRKLGIGMIGHPATIVKKQVYDKYGLYDESFYIAADMDWFLRLCENDVKFSFFDAVITTFTIGGVSTIPNFSKNLHDRALLFKKHTKSKFSYCMHLTNWILHYFRDQYFPWMRFHNCPNLISEK